MSALSVYQPVTSGGRMGWEGARLLASAGGFRLLPRGQAPPLEVQAAVAPYCPRGSTLAVARTNSPGRYIALIIDDDGTARAIAKVATTPAGLEALERELTAIRRFGSWLKPPLSPPRVRAFERGILVLDPVRWKPRLRPWLLTADVARALGSFFRAGCSKVVPLLGPAHGDFAPWNLLRTERGWVVLDWEDACEQRPALFDVFHYLVQAHSLLGRPSDRSITEGLVGRGPVARVVAAYAEGAALELSGVQELFDEYLHITLAVLEPDRPDRRTGISTRLSLLGRTRT